MTKYISLEEFVKFGYLQELNRQFLHPLGLAMEVVYDAAGNCVGISGIWDYRDDPEGIIYHESVLNSEDSQRKAERVREELEEKGAVRQERFGFVVQPLDLQNE
jgi:hypothetical protein